MSTNYYISFRRALAEGIPTEWLKMIHIAQRSSGGILLQTIRGEDRFNTELVPSNIEATVGSAFYWSPIREIPSVENWEQMKALITNPEYAIVDEYDTEVKVADFINMVENQEDGTDSRYHHMTEWRDNQDSDSWHRRTPRTDYLDKDGFSFEMRKFS